MNEGNTWIVVLQVVLTGIAAVAAVVPAWRKMGSERRRQDADAAGVVTDKALAMLDVWQDRVRALEVKVEGLEQVIAGLQRLIEYWRRGCAILLRQLVENDLEPIWQPDESGLDGGEPGS